MWWYEDCGGMGLSEADSVWHSQLKSLEHHSVRPQISLMLFHLLSVKATLSKSIFFHIFKQISSQTRKVIEQAKWDWTVYRWKMCSWSSPVLYVFFFSQTLKQPYSPSTPTAGTWQPEAQDLAAWLMKHLSIQAALHHTSVSSYPSPPQSPVDPFAASSIRSFGCKTCWLDFNWHQWAKLHRSNCSFVLF